MSERTNMTSLGRANAICELNIVDFYVLAVFDIYNFMYNFTKAFFTLYLYLRVFVF